MLNQKRNKKSVGDISNTFLVAATGIEPVTSRV